MWQRVAMTRYFSGVTEHVQFLLRKGSKLRTDGEAVTTCICVCFLFTLLWHLATLRSSLFIIRSRCIGRCLPALAERSLRVRRRVTFEIHSDVLKYTKQEPSKPGIMAGLGKKIFAVELIINNHPIRPKIFAAAGIINTGSQCLFHCNMSQSPRWKGQIIMDG